MYYLLLFAVCSLFTLIYQNKKQKVSKNGNSNEIDDEEKEEKDSRKMLNWIKKNCYLLLLYTLNQKKHVFFEWQEIRTRSLKLQSLF